MNLTINKTNFGGKKEVIYGLKKASKSASYIEKARSSSCGPRPVNMSLEAYKHRGELNAYLDMVVSDDAFVETISEISKSKKHKMYDELHQNLKPIMMHNVEFSPFTTFQDAFKTACSSKLPIETNQEKGVFTRFFENVALGLSQKR